MKNNKVLIIITLIMLLTLIIYATYAYFSTGLLNVTNVANLNAVTERNNMVFDTIGGEMTLNVTAASMSESLSGNIAAGNNTTLIVNFTPNTDYSMVCTYDIIYEWTSSDRYTAHTSGVTDDEFTIWAYFASLYEQGVYDENVADNLSEGANYIQEETDLSDIVGNQNSAVVVSGATISSIGNATVSAEWWLASLFYNVDADQSTLSGKTYAGRFKVANVSCTAGTASPSGPTSYWFDTNTCTGPNPCTHPNYGGMLESSGTATGHNVYIGQDSSKYYACGTIQGHEICLSQPYTQYGLSGHTLNSSLTSEQQASAKQAIYQAFIDAGITLDISDCSANDGGATCDVGDLGCGVYLGGYVACGDNSTGDGSIVDASGRANCLGVTEISFWSSARSSELFNILNLISL